MTVLDGAAVRLRFLGLITLIIVAGCLTNTSPSSPPVGPTAAPTGTAGDGCAVAEQTGVLRSNTLVDMDVRSDGVSDFVVFTLGEEAANPIGNGNGRLKAAQPPFAQGGSGLPVEIEGGHFVEVHFDGMLIADEVGGALYQGETSLKPDMVALKQVEMTEAFEGVYNLVIGYDGDGCVGLSDDAATKTLTLTIDH